MTIDSTIYYFMMYFFIYGFLGWCGEVAFATRHGCFVNRGFLNGPICPIYGVGVGLVVTLMKPFMHNVVVVYVGGAVLVTVVEFFTGLIMDKMFHHKWWDYSNKPLNIGGYVCLLFSLIWGVALVIIVEIINPVITTIIDLVPRTAGVVILVILELALLADIIATVVGINEMNARLDAMESISKELKKISDSIGENVYTETTKVVADAQEKKEAHDEAAQEQKEAHEEAVEERKEKFEEKKEEHEEAVEKRKEKFEEKKEEHEEAVEERKEKFEEKKEEYKEGREETQEEKEARQKELQDEYDRLASSHTIVSKRLLRAFPYMESRDHKDHLESMKKHAPVNPKRAAAENTQTNDDTYDDTKDDTKDSTNK